MQCVCMCGSRARDVSGVNSAETKFPVSRSFCAPPGTGGNTYFAFRQTPEGWRFLGDIWFRAFRILSADPKGRPRILTSSRVGGGRCSVSLYVLGKNGFHETMTRKNLP